MYIFFIFIFSSQDTPLGSVPNANDQRSVSEKILYDDQNSEKREMLPT